MTKELRRGQILTALLLGLCLAGCGSHTSSGSTPVPLSSSPSIYPRPLSQTLTLPDGGSISVPDTYVGGNVPDALYLPRMNINGKGPSVMFDPYAPDGREDFSYGIYDGDVAAKYERIDSGSYFDDKWQRGAEVRVSQHFREYTWKSRVVWYGRLTYEDKDGFENPTIVLLVKSSTHVVAFSFVKHNSDSNLAEQRALAIFSTANLP